MYKQILKNGADTKNWIILQFKMLIIRLQLRFMDYMIIYNSKNGSELIIIYLICIYKFLSKKFCRVSYHLDLTTFMYIILWSMLPNKK